MKSELIKFYHAHAFTDNYILGVEIGGNVYAVKKKMSLADMERFLTTQTASRGQGMALKFAPTKAQKAEILADGNATILCSKTYLEKLVESTRWNRGQIFEKLVTEKAGQSWKADNIPFTKAGDIEIDGVAYQIKYQKASFLSEGQMFRLMEKDNK